MKYFFPHMEMNPIESYLHEIDKFGARKTILQYKLYADIQCDSCMPVCTRDAVYSMIVDDLIADLWHMITRDLVLGNDFARKHAFLRQIWHDQVYTFTLADMCAVRNLNRGIRLRKTTMPVLNMFKSIM